MRLERFRCNKLKRHPSSRHSLDEDRACTGRSTLGQPDEAKQTPNPVDLPQYQKYPLQLISRSPFQYRQSSVCQCGMDVGIEDCRPKPRTNHSIPSMWWTSPVYCPGPIMPLEFCNRIRGSFPTVIVLEKVCHVLPLQVWLSSTKSSSRQYTAENWYTIGQHQNIPNSPLSSYYCLPVATLLKKDRTTTSLLRMKDDQESKGNTCLLVMPRFVSILTWPPFLVLSYRDEHFPRYEKHKACHRA